MKFRTDFVTNSSSSSFIAVFARIVDREKAQPIIDKYGYEVYTGKEVLQEMKDSRWFRHFDCDWAGVYLTPSEDYINKHSDSEFIYYRSCDDIDESDGEPNYDIDKSDFSDEILEAIEAVVKKNGFTDIESGYGAGRNG